MVTGASGIRATTPQTPQATGPDAAPATAVERPVDGGPSRAWTPSACLTERRRTPKGERSRSKANRRAAHPGTLAAAREWIEQWEADAPQVDVPSDPAEAHAAFKARLRAVRQGTATGPVLTAGEASEALSAACDGSAGTTPDGPSRNTESRVAADAPETRADLAKWERRFELRGDRRQAQMRQVDDARDITTLPSLAKCGVKPIAGAVEITYTPDGDGGFAGFFRCGSVWSCPECAPIVRAQRAADVERYAAAWFEAGHGIAMATFTTRHWHGAQLDIQMERTTLAWKKLQQSRWWKDPKTGFRARYGIVGFARAIEMTHNWANSWHTHIHAVLWTEKPVPEEEARHMEAELYQRWAALAKKVKLGVPSRKHGVKVDPAKRTKKGFGDLAKYLVKVQDKDATAKEIAKGKSVERSLGNELLRGDMKAAQRQGRTPFEILRRALEESAPLRREIRKADRVLARAHKAANHEAIRAKDGEAGPAALARIEAAEQHLAVLKKRLASEYAEVKCWQEYERATKGHRMLTWGGEIKERLAELTSVNEKDGQEIVTSEDNAPEKKTMYQVRNEPIAAAFRAVPGRRGRLKAAVKVGWDEGHGLPGAQAAVTELLTDWGLTFGVDFWLPHAVDGTPMPVAPRSPKRRASTATITELDATQHVIGVSPRDWVLPERAARRAAGLPVRDQITLKPRKATTP